MTNAKAARVSIFITLVLLFASFGAGYTVAFRNNQDRISEYETRLADAENINLELQNENTRLANLARSVNERLDEITGRINRAGEIARGLENQITTDGNTVDRLIERLRIIEEAFEVLFPSD
jgi:peptidoglycan hydrolase CwlO-like protein